MNALTILTLLLITFGTAEKSLTIRHTECRTTEMNSLSPKGTLVTGWYYITDTKNGFQRQLEEGTETFYINPNPIIIAMNFATIEIVETIEGEKKSLGLSIQLDKKGTGIWSLATARSIGKRLAFILDNKLIYAPLMNAQSKSGVFVINDGKFTKKQLENIKSILEKEHDATK